MKISKYWYSDVGGRDENEDSADCREFDGGIVAVVADGLGGQGDGKAASQLICDRLAQNGAELGFPNKDTLTQLFAQANQELISRQKNSFHMKTTAVYLCIEDDRAVWAHIGDSRLYHLWNGKLCHYTLDHSAAQLAVYMGKITREQIPSDPGQSRLLRAMGVEEEHPDIHEPITLASGRHVFLLCSDGLWEYLSDKEIEYACSVTDTPEELVRFLRAEKDKRSPKNCDNHSAVAVFAEVE